MQADRGAADGLWARERALTVVPAEQRPTNYARSLFHLASASTGVACVALFSTRAPLLIIAGAFATYAWSMEIARRASPRLNARLMAFYGRVAHPHEWHRVNSATWYATALVLLAAFASRPGMIAGLAVLGVADPLAGLVGRRFGRHKLRSGKSLEGALAFVLSGAIAAFGALALVDAGDVTTRLTLAALGALVGAVVELSTGVLDDNFTIPVAVGASLTLVTGFPL